MTINHAIKIKENIKYVVLILIIITATWGLFGHIVRGYWLILWPSKPPTYLIELTPQPSSHYSISDLPLDEWWRPYGPERPICVRVDAKVIRSVFSSSIDAYESVNFDRVTLYINNKKIDGEETYWSNGILKPVEAKYRVYSIPNPNSSDRYLGKDPVDFCWHYDLKPGVYFAKLVIETEGFLRLRYAWAFRILP